MTHYPADTVSALLERGAGDAPAIGAPGRPWLTHGALRAQARRSVGELNAMGIGRGDRVGAGAAERAGSRVRVRHHRLRRHHRAAEPGLQGR